MTRRLRIAFFLHEFPALSETFVLNQVTGLLDLGHDVTIFAERPRREPQVHPDVARYDLRARTRYLGMPRNKLARMALAPGIALRHQLHARGMARPALSAARFGRDAWSLRLLYWSSRLLDEAPFDFIHCHFGPVGQLAVKLREVGALRGPIGTVFHGVDISAYVRRDHHYYDDLFRKGDLFLPISDRWRHRLVELGCDPRRILVHRMGVDAGRYPFRARRYAPGRALRLLTVGRMVDKKGMAYGLRAVAALNARGIPVHYTIIGDGERRQRLIRLAARLGISAQVNFVGWQDQDNVIRHMDASDILLAPSITTRNGDQEGIPVVLMEAMASGLLVIATEHSGIPELVEHGRSGILVPERNAAALAEALAGLTEDPAQWPVLSRAARMRILSEFEIGSLNTALVDHYRRLSAGSGAFAPRHAASLPRRAQPGLARLARR